MSQEQRENEGKRHGEKKTNTNFVLVSLKYPLTPPTFWLCLLFLSTSRGVGPATQTLPSQPEDRTSPAELWSWTSTLPNCETADLLFKAQFGLLCYSSWLSWQLIFKVILCGKKKNPCIHHWEQCNIHVNFRMKRNFKENLSLQEAILG